MYNWVRVTGTGQQTDQSMRRAENLISNFVEQVPMNLVLLGFLESGGVMGLPLHMLGGALIVSRLLHAFGTSHMAGAGLMRFIGAQMGYLLTLIGSMACIYLFWFRAL
jgi:uncharacterized membrane protein YecN with MAPEG domain